MRRRIFSIYIPILVTLALVLSPLTAFAEPISNDGSATGSSVYLPLVMGEQTTDATNADDIVVASAQTSRQIPASGTAALRSNPNGVDGIQQPEFAGGFGPDAAAASSGHTVHAPKQVVNRSYSAPAIDEGPAVDEGPVVESSSTMARPQLLRSFDGLNFRQQRLANGGNQFSVEPPDQGLCVGNGFVLETVNDVLRVFDTAGNPAIGVVDLNSFYGYPAAINRTTGERGPFVTDPSCYYDPDTHRWFHVVLTLDTNPANGNFLGTNHLDIAVSQTADPTGVWNVYQLPTQNDGTQGTPDHGCSLNADGSGHGPCFADYPHIGADAYGFYITTNEYSFFGPEYKSANLYAFSKQALASGAALVGVIQQDTVGAVKGKPGFTIWPAISPSGEFNTQNHGTEYFLSSNAAEEAGGNGKSKDLIQWGLSNTASLGTAHPSLTLKLSVLSVNTYSMPPKANQKRGNVPLAECLNDAKLLTPFGLGCWTLFFTAGGPFHEKESVLDTNDTRIQQVYYADGRLVSALDTAVKVGGKTKAGIAWYIVDPRANSGKGQLKKQGYLALANNHLSYPAVAINADGDGAIAFTVTGNDYYPSAGYASFDSSNGPGNVRIAAAGVGPQDGFSGYNVFADSGVARPRWGDYGAAVADGSNIWLASEYIAQTCTLDQYTTAPIGSCGGTRAALGNWATRITQVKP
ncbi:MAG: hypothetical protein U0350_24335 [Caldilineaceae bacterium]